MARLLTRRSLLTSAALAAPALLLPGCDWLGSSPSFRDLVLGSGEWLSYNVHRLIGSQAMAREFDPSEMSPNFRTNGNTQPRSPDYRRHAGMNFADWKLTSGRPRGHRPRHGRSRSSARCRPARRSPAMTAWKAGAPSANGPACRSPSC